MTKNTKTTLTQLFLKPLVKQNLPLPEGEGRLGISKQKRRSQGEGRKRYLHLTFVIGYLTLLALPSFAGVGSSSGAEFLRLTGGARPIALGDAYVGLADDASAMFYNPAGLAQIQFLEGLSMSDSSFAQLEHQMLGVAAPMAGGVIALGYSGIGAGSIPGYGTTGEVTSAYSTNHSFFNFSFGRKVNNKLSIGVGLKGISERLEDASAATTAIDVGIHYRYDRYLTVGLAMLNYGSPLKFVSDETPLPTCYRLGGSLQTTFFGEDLNLVSDIISYSDETYIAYGCEFLLRDSIVLRAGMNRGNLHVGAGIKANLLSVDYAYRNHDDLGATSQISLGILLGASERAKTKYYENIALGQAYLKDGEFSQAIVNFGKALDLEPKSEEAALLLRKATAELENETLRSVFSEREGKDLRDIEAVLDSAEDFLKAEKYIEAMGEITKALKIDASNRRAIQLQSSAQLRMEKQLVEKSKTESKQYLAEAMKLVVLGQHKDALVKIEDALALDPKNPEALALKKKLLFIIKLGN